MNLKNNKHNLTPLNKTQFCSQLCNTNNKLYNNCFWQNMNICCTWKMLCLCETHTMYVMFLVHDNCCSIKYKRTVLLCLKYRFKYLPFAKCSRPCNIFARHEWTHHWRWSNTVSKATERKSLFYVLYFRLSTFLHFDLLKLHNCKVDAKFSCRNFSYNCYITNHV